jgi:hypothetical protein
MGPAHFAASVVVVASALVAQWWRLADDRTIRPDPSQAIAAPVQSAAPLGAPTPVPSISRRSDAIPRRLEQVAPLAQPDTVDPWTGEDLARKPGLIALDHIDLDLVDPWDPRVRTPKMRDAPLMEDDAPYAASSP